MEQTGIFEGKIVGAGTKLRTEHSTVGGSATVLASYGANLIVTADQKWTCDVANAAKLAEVGRLADALGVELWELLRPLTPTQREFYRSMEALLRDRLDVEAKPTDPQGKPVPPRVA